MTGYTFEEIVKWIIAGFLIVIGLYLLYLQFIPGASGMFWEKINNATGIFKFGKEKMDYEFEMPSYMVNNVEAINETIFILKDKNLPVEATPEEIIEQSLKLEAFKKSELTVRQDYSGKLKMMVKNEEGQIEFYKTEIPYSPCIIDIKSYTDGTRYIREDFDYRIKYASEHIKFVEKINFKDETTFKVEKDDDKIYEGDYVFLEEYAFIKINKNLCFVGYRTS